MPYFLEIHKYVNKNAANLIGLSLVLSTGLSFLNIGVVISAIFSSFGICFCFIHYLMQFARSLQIHLFISFTILVGIAPLVSLAGFSKFIILEISSLLTKLKSNKKSRDYKRLLFCRNRL